VHPAVEVAWIDGAGAAAYGIGSRTLELTADSAVVVPAGVEHATTLAPGTRAVSLWIRPATVLELLDAMGSPTTGRLDARLIGKPERLAALGRILLEDAQTDAPGRELSATAITEALVVELLRQAGASERVRGVGDPRIAMAVEYIESALAEPLSIELLARTVQMGRFHFSRVFAAEVGVSPHRFLVRARITRAAALLRSGRVSVTEAALSVGFSDLGRFARAFRLQLGCTPSAYARRGNVISIASRVGRVRPR
jgi:AraC-like DNA-binding protein